jgi:hypothetical protein
VSERTASRPPLRWLAATCVLALPLLVQAQLGQHTAADPGKAPRVLTREIGKPRPRPPDAYRVILISIDGLSPDVLAAAHAPTLARLAHEGTHAARAETVVPPTTLPAHTSMLSGLPAEAHGVRWNRYYPWLRIDADTLFTLCRRHSRRCGLFSAKEKMAHFAEHEPGVERFGLDGKRERVLALAENYLGARDPDFTMIHLGDVDGVGHVLGWGSPDQIRAIERIDRELGPFLERARATGSGRLAVLVTSDHGGSGRHHGGAEPVDFRIPWILWGDGIPARTIEERVSILDVAPTVLELLGIPVPPSWPGKPRYPA